MKPEPYYEDDMDSANFWELSHQADPRARVLADRHYSRKTPGSRQFTPPGRKLVLVSTTAYWVTSWPFTQFVKHEWAGAWLCSAFRNEGERLSSDLIREAIAVTRWRWPEVPELGMVTFVDATKVRKKRDPGRCFKRAGFAVCGQTKGGLIALQLSPCDMPQPLRPMNPTPSLFK